MSADLKTSPPVRPFYWSVRRELWEHPAVVVAPLAIGGVILVGSILSTFTLPEAVRAVAAGKSGDRLMMGYVVEALAVMLTGMIVAIFYSLGALYGERRDRGMLFWKSMPVSDATTVLSKAAIPLLVVPVATIAIIVALQLAILVWSTLVVLANRLDVLFFWKHADLSLMWVVLPYGLIVNALWQAPLFAWFILVSAWAKRTPSLWALAPMVAPMILEAIMFRTHHFAAFIGERIYGGFGEAFSIGGQGKAPIQEVGQLDPIRVLSLPGLWLGLMAAAGFLAAAIWLRRRREPL